jgi:hypothetical protein
LDVPAAAPEADEDIDSILVVDLNFFCRDERKSYGK